jgi:16S rRNA G966 N2-methylase RsmD
VQGSTIAALSKFEADIYFLDPPYTMPMEYQAALDILGEQKLRPSALVVAQHPKRLDLEEEYGALKRVRALTQGDNVVSFFE